MSRDHGRKSKGKFNIMSSENLNVLCFKKSMSLAWGYGIFLKLPNKFLKYKKI